MTNFALYIENQHIKVAFTGVSSADARNGIGLVLLDLADKDKKPTVAAVSDIEYHVSYAVTGPVNREQQRKLAERIIELVPDITEAGG
ncbi:hypothetical protein OG689_41510 [Kitasatospora sp. NBC_00240]|uniref:hypothetical protein n=1 Tax=Kitasatospora sp. NBC_00240 TaxID=2903567 RepID=UPI00225C040F|nr:hypothetical protein [Kitasatospora sp. NBC_00240]MCX5215635.1 hypothetical protein [Kitasatospora sp. NBC_00240]